MDNPKLNYLQHLLKQATESNNFGETLYNSVDKLLRIAIVIKNTHGEPGWASKVLDANGNQVFDPSEQQQIESTLQPLVPHILYLLGETNTAPQMGGAVERSSIDKVRNSIINTINSANRSTQEFAADSGIVKMEKSDIDYYPFAPFLAVPGIGPIISQIPISPRAAIFFAYLAFELTRIFVASPYPAARSTMSIMIAIVDLLRGDWKKAILSFAGYYSENAMMAGVYGKIFLSVYSMISPDIRDSIAYGMFDVAKSVIVGTVIQVVQLFAPMSVRMVINQGLTDLRAIIVEPEVTAIPTATDFEGNPLPQKKDYYRDLTFDDIQNIQAILRDPTRNCSKEFQGAIASLKESPLIENLLQLLGIPTLDEDIERMCGKPILDYANNLARDRLREAEKMYTETKSTAPAPSAAPAAVSAPSAESAQTSQAASAAQVASAATPAESAPASANNENPTPASAPPASAQKPILGGHRKLRFSLISLS